MVKVKISDWKADSSMDEAYKALRTNIQFCGADKKVIAFTSCTPNEGKSNVTFHLALPLQRVVNLYFLIDADLRKSVLMGRVQVEEEVKGLEPTTCPSRRNCRTLSAQPIFPSFTLFFPVLYRRTRQSF